MTPRSYTAKIVLAVVVGAVGPIVAALFYDIWLPWMEWAGMAPDVAKYVTAIQSIALFAVGFIWALWHITEQD